MSHATKHPPEILRHSVGQTVHDLDTPALVIDLDAMSRNLKRMAEFARKHKVAFRPHAKMHKSGQLARLQMQAGAVGVCVQKTSEAEIMAAKGVHNIFISNEVISRTKLKRVAALAQTLATHEGGRLAIAVDSLDGISRLSEAMQETAGTDTVIDVFIELDVGQGRCGVPPGGSVVMLAQQIGRNRTMRFAGLHAYHGGSQHLRSVAERREAIAKVVALVQKTRQVLGAAAIDVPLVTGAGTGTFGMESASGVFGEIQAGSFLFMDADYAQNDRDPVQPSFEHALFVKSQVISVQPIHVVVDAGHKSHAIDSGMPKVHRFDDTQLIFQNGGDEHGIVTAESHDIMLPGLGETVWLIPGHCDPTVNLHDYMIGVRGGLQNGVVERILKVDARGAFS